MRVSMLFRSVLSSCVAASALGSAGCLTTHPSREAPVQTLEAKWKVSEVEKDTIAPNGDFLKKGLIVSTFDGFFADGALVDELTLYHLAGDAKREEEIVAYRSEYNTAVLAGWGGSAAGALMVVAGGAMLAVLGESDPDFIVSDTGRISVGLMAGGGLVLATAPVAAGVVLMPERSLTREGNTYGFSEELVFSLNDASAAITAFEQGGDTAPPSESAAVTDSPPQE